MLKPRSLELPTPLLAPSTDLIDILYKKLRGRIESARCTSTSQAKPPRGEFGWNSTAGIIISTKSTANKATGKLYSSQQESYDFWQHIHKRRQQLHEMR